MSTITASDLDGAIDTVHAANGGRYPWSLIGVFPTEGSCEPEDYDKWWNAFLYTVGFSPTIELWIPHNSIEGWGGGFDLMGAYLNAITAGFSTGLIGYGDTVRLPIGIPGEEDADAVFWLPQFPDTARRRQVFQSQAPWCIPILWSSPLGWGDE